MAETVEGERTPRILIPESGRGKKPDISPIGRQVLAGLGWNLSHSCTVQPVSQELRVA